MPHFIDTNKELTLNGLCGLGLTVLCLYWFFMIGMPPSPSTAETSAGSRSLLVFPRAGHQPDDRELGALMDFQNIWDSPTKVKGIDNVGSEISPAGDTYFIRHPNGFSHRMKALPETRRLFQLADISQDYHHKRALLLKAGETTDDPLIQYRVYIGVARAAFRSHDRQALKDRKVFTQLALKSPVTGPWKSDAHYLKAQVLLGGGKRRPALDQLEESIALDPYYLEAHWAVIRLAAGLLDDPHTREPESRLQFVTWLLSSLERSMDLTKNRGDFHQIGAELQSGVQGASEVFFAAGYCYYHAGEFDRAVRSLNWSLQKKGISGLSQDEIRKRAVMLLDSMKMAKEGEV